MREKGSDKEGEETSQVWWHTPGSLVLGRQTQEDQELGQPLLHSELMVAWAI